MPRLRPALRFALAGLVLALLVTVVVAGPWAPMLLVALAPALAPAIAAGLVFAAAAGHWLEGRRLAGRWWVGGLLGLTTLLVATLTAGACAWVGDGLGDPAPYVLTPLRVALAFGGAPSLLLGVLYARGRALRSARCWG